MRLKVFGIFSCGIQKVAVLACLEIDMPA